MTPLFIRNNTFTFDSTLCCLTLKQDNQVKVRTTRRVAQPRIYNKTRLLC